MPPISLTSPVWVLAIVAAIMLVLALNDLVRHRRITSAFKARILISIIFTAVVVWLLRAA